MKINTLQRVFFLSAALASISIQESRNITHIRQMKKKCMFLSKVNSELLYALSANIFVVCMCCDIQIVPSLEENRV